MTQAHADRVTGAATSVGLHLLVTVLALSSAGRVIGRVPIDSTEGRQGPEVFFVDKLPDPAPAAAGLNSADPAEKPWTPKVDGLSVVGVGANKFDLTKIMGRATLLFPFLTPGISLDRFGLEPSRDDDKHLEMPTEFARARQPRADQLKPPFAIGAGVIQALVDKSWSRRDRWRAFQALAGFTEAYNPDTGQLAAVLRGYTEQNGLQPYSDPGMRDPRMWTELQIAADHVEFIGFISKYASGHPSTRTTTELLFLLDKQVQASRDALVTLLDTDPWADLEWTRRSNLDAVTFIVELQRHFNGVLVRKKLLSRGALGNYYDAIRMDILDGILRTSPGGYRKSDAHYLKGGILWRQGRRTEAMGAWRDIRIDPDAAYRTQNADIVAALGRLSARPAALDLEIERILAADTGRWLSDSIDRLKKFGLKMDQY